LRRKIILQKRETGSPISSKLAMSRNLASENPAQVTASHGPGIQPRSQSGNRLIEEWVTPTSPLLWFKSFQSFKPLRKTEFFFGGEL